MSLSVARTSHESGIEVLTLTGSLTLGRDAQQLEWTIEELLKSATRLFILDMKDVPFVDSAGIGILIGCQGKISAAGGQLRLANAGERVVHVLQVTKVDSILSLDRSVADSITAILGA